VSRYTCNTWDEAVNSGRFDVVVIGSGMFGAYMAAKAYRDGAAQGLRVLVLEAGPLLVTEHVQNLTRIGLNAAGPVANDPGVPRERVWGLPWRSNAPFTGLAYAVGGRSLYWGGWAPRLTPADLANWPQETAKYLEQTYRDVEVEIGAYPTTDYIHGALQKEIKRILDSARPSVPTVDEVQDAPLAVQGATPRSGLFSFDKFSAAPILLDAIRESVGQAGGNDAKRRLFLVPRVHVTRLQTEGALVVGVHVRVNGEPRYYPLSPGASVVLANGTIEATRVALASFPTPLMGRNLMGHLRSNLTVRIPRSALTNVGKQLETAACLVRGHTPEGRYHFQVTAVGTNSTNSEDQMWRMIPDIDLVHKMENAHPDFVVLTLRGIGEMTGDKTPGKVSAKNWMDLSPYETDEYGEPRAWVNLTTTPEHERLWKAMNAASLQLAQQLAKNASDVQHLIDGQWSPTPPTESKLRDGLGTTHHEAGTLWMGADPNQSVTTQDGRFHHMENAYVVGPAVFPSLGSANPTLTALALARRTASAIATPPAVEPGFTSLYNGTLDGWQMAGWGGFDAAPTILESRGGIGLLWHTRERFADFVLKLDYRQHARDDNSGVFLRVPALATSDPANDWRPAVTQGYEVQIDERGYNPDTNTEDNPDHSTGAIYTQAPATKKAARPIGSWNEYEIEAKGRTIRVRLNGELVSTLTNASRSLDGYIGLQNHHDGSRVQFRNIRVKRL
jgi:choline dehydrogenase-like flavoprotein